MPRWLRRIRGMIGTGLAFAVGGPVIVAIIGAGFWMFGEASLGGVARFAAFMAMGLSGAFSRWSTESAIVNLLLLTSVGAGSAAATLFVARKAKRAQDREEPIGIGQGPATEVDASRDTAPARHRE